MNCRRLTLLAVEIMAVVGVRKNYFNARGWQC